jgi:LuxR family transcriptional regulator, maltose regulon positive regulatory protein
MLLTKLHIPAPGNNLVHRAALIDKLNEGFNRKLILISAPAGFGKTTLISDWINQNQIPTAWFSLDKGDNDPVEFLSYIIAGVQSLCPAFGQSALKLLKSLSRTSNESIAGLLVNDMLNINKDTFIVLDDFHLIDSSEISQLVTYLLEHIPDNIHIVILTRSDPNLPLAKIRSQHQLLELRSQELSFSVNDISVLFNKKLKISLSVDDAYSLEAKTEGWVAGLQLTALSIKNRNDVSGFIRDLKGDNRYIMDYLIEEVLKIQSDSIKEFLLQTSVLGQISAPLCNSVLDRLDSQQILENLEKNNMFVIPLDSERKWYRYHHLFADLLKQRLLLQHKSTIDKLHNKASDWFEQNNMYELAIEHALEIKNYEKSIQILGETVESMWENGLHSAILKYGDLIPDELIIRNPTLCLYYSWILITTGQVQKAEPFLVSAENLTKKIIDDQDSPKDAINLNKMLLGKIFVAFAYLISNEENTGRVFEYCEKAMENLKDDNTLWYSWIWFSSGIAYYSNADLHKSNEAFEKALKYAKKSGNIYLISSIAIRLGGNEQQLGHYRLAYKKCSELLTFMNKRGYSQLATTEWTYAGVYIHMASSLLLWAEIEKAQEYAKIAYDLSKSCKDITMKLPILIIYTGLFFASGDMKSAEIKMNEIEDVLKHNCLNPYLTYLYVYMKIYMFSEMNQFEQAENIISEYGLGLDKKKSHMNYAAYSAYVRLLLIQNKLDEAELLLSELYPLAKEGNSIERLIPLKIYYAIVYKMRGDHEKAISNLIEALALAADENLLTYFLFDLNFTNDLMMEVYKKQATEKTKIPSAFIDKLKLAIERKETLKKNPVETGLSTRELDTLKLIAENLSNQEIADKLFISLNTVKTHLKNINLKLEVDSRSEAVTKAKERGLI